MSHAANHGYSHLSGIDSTSPAAKWRQLWLRPVLRSSGGRRPVLVAVEPAIHHVAVVLLAPQHAGKRLTLDVAHVVGKRERRDAMVEGVGFALAQVERGVEFLRKRLRDNVRVAKAQPDHRGFPGRHLPQVVRRRLGAELGGIHDALFAMHEEVVEGVLHVRRRVGRPKMRSALVSFSVNSNSSGVSQYSE